MAAGVRDLAASKTSKKYHIKLADWLFVDPTFSKKYSTYLPLKKTFLNSRLVDIMSPTCFKLVVILLDHAHIVRSSCYDLDANMLPSCREPVENVLLRLVEYQVLTESPFLINKLINKLNNELNIICSEPEKLVQNLPAKIQKKVVEKITLRFSESQTIEVQKALINSWADTYPKEFLDQELKKARSWVLANSHKTPKKNWGRFLNNWFNRGWETYRKTLTSNPPKITVDDLNEILGGVL